MEWALAIAAAYLAGSMPFGFWIVRLRFGEDIRRHGSGNVGATNVWRSFGRSYGLLVLALDLAKGFVPALLAAQLIEPAAGALAGGAAMLGHWRPLFLGFKRGGKMVATAGGALFGLAPLVALVAFGVWLIVVVIGRYVSLGSIAAALSLVPAALLLDEPTAVVVFVAAAAVGVIALHRPNIKRLLAGSENRFELRRSADSAAS